MFEQGIQQMKGVWNRYTQGLACWKDTGTRMHDSSCISSISLMSRSQFHLHFGGKGQAGLE